MGVAVRNRTQAKKAKKPKKTSITVAKIRHGWSKKDRLHYRSKGFKKAFADFLGSDDRALGKLTAHQQRVLEQMIECQGLSLGVRRCQCQNPECHAMRYYTNTCQTRFCTACAFTKKQKFLERVQSFVLDCPYFFITFNLPFRLRPLAHDERNRRVVLACLQKAIVDTILSICKQPASKVQPGFLPGIIAALHTFNKQAQWHPHFHLVVTAGGVPLTDIRKQKKLGYAPETIEGAWVSESFLPIDQLRDRGQAKLAKLLRKAHRDGRLKFKKGEEFFSYERFSEFVSGVYQSSQVVHVQRSGKGKHAGMTQQLEYALRYLGHPPLAVGSFVYNETRGMVQWTPKGSGASKGQRSPVRLTLGEFALRMIQHIPGKQDRVTGCYGLYASKQTKRALTIAKADPQFKESDFTKRIRDQEKRERNQAFVAWQKKHKGNPNPPTFRVRFGVPWRSRVKQSFGKDPLKCSRCGSEMTMARKSTYFSKAFCQTHKLSDGQIVKIEDG